MIINLCKVRYKKSYIQIIMLKLYTLFRALKWVLLQVDKNLAVVIILFNHY